MKHWTWFSHRAVLIGILCVWLIGASTARAQMSPEQQAELLLNSARKAFNDKNYSVAATKFREFLGRFAATKDAPAARYGLALTLLDGPDKKYEEAREIMQTLSALKDFSDRALATYFAGVANRGLGLNELAQAESKPAEAVQRRANAQARFNEAIPFFANASTSFMAKLNVPTDGKSLTPDAEWVARARCDLAEMQLRVGKLKEAQSSTMPFVSDPLWSKSRYANLGRYLHGYASVLLKDNVAGQKTLSMLAPFEDPVFGNHARYLLARTYHLADERAEAMAQYEAAIADYNKSKTEAGKLLRQPQKLKNDPDLRARLEALVRNPPPDHVARSLFYLGVLQYEGGKFSDARTRFAEFVKQFPQSPLRQEAELRIGYCQVQSREFKEAIKTLAPLVEKDVRLADQVLLWLGKAQAGLAPEANANPQAHKQSISNAINTLRTAADRAQKIAGQDPEAKVRRGEILLEMADQMQRIGQNKEAASIYSQLMNDKVLPEREEEIMQRWTDALHLAGDHDGSDKACQVFQQRFAQSTLMPAVLFTFAENSFFRIVNAEKIPDPAERAKRLPPLYEETAKRFRAVIEKYPEYPKINIARYSLGLTLYRQGDLPGAQKALAEIAGPDRNGELALTSYLIADCVLRQVPAVVPDDALGAGKMEEQLKSAAEQLDAFVNGQPGHPSIADALIKLGLCQQRLAGLIAQPQERAKMYQTARATYDRLLKKGFANNPRLAEQARVERAKCIAQAGDVNGAINELRKFTSDPLRQSPIAPQAVLQLATYLRAQNRPAEALELFAKNREHLENVLNKDKEKGPSLVALLRYHHGVALQEARKLPEARAVFESVVKMGTQRPEGLEAALRVGQCLKDEGRARLEEARKMRQSSNPKNLAQVQKLADDGYKLLRDSAAYLESHADQVKAIAALQEIRGRMLYETAWNLRLLSEPEVTAAREAINKETISKLNVSSAKFGLPEVPLEKIPLQPSEKKAQATYKALIEQAGDLPIGTQARFELAELLVQRGEVDPAAQLLSDVLDKEPGPELTEKVRLHMGTIQAVKGNLKAALAQFDAVASNPKSSLAGWAHYRAGEALIKNQQYPDAIKRLAVFRDQQPWQNVPGLTDRALIRLGYSYAHLKDWNNSRSSYERLVNAFPGSVWGDEARYGVGWAMQQQHNPEGAVEAYRQVVSRTATELAARAQIQIGVCRMEQKRYLDAANAFLVVPSTYDYPELRAAALLEAGKAYGALNQRDQANRQFERILREHPGTPWADAAKENLGKQ